MGQWAITVPQEEYIQIINRLLQGTAVPETSAEITCIPTENDGSEPFFTVGMCDQGGWFAPMVFEEPQKALDIPSELLGETLDGTKPEQVQPLVGVVFLNEEGNDLTVDHTNEKGETQRTKLRFNLTNWFAAGGTVSEDRKVWEIKLGSVLVKGHLALVGMSNKQRVFGSIAYVTLTQPERVAFFEALTVAPKALLQAQWLCESLKAALMELEAKKIALLEAQQTIKNLGNQAIELQSKIQLAVRTLS
jgi:hypothetical protein